MTPIGIFFLWFASTIGGAAGAFILYAYLASNSR